MGLWTAWLAFARIALYEVADTARLEVNQAAHPLEASVGGRIVAANLIVGREAQVGDVLIELDAEAERLQLEEQRTLLTSLQPQIKALRDEIAAEERVQGGGQQSAGVDEARVRYEEAKSSATFAQEEADRLARLHASGVVPEVDLLRARAEAQKRRAAADSIRLEIIRLESNQRIRESEHQVSLERLSRQLAQLEGQLATGAALVKRLEYEIEKHHIRAPVSGRLGETADVRVGVVIRAGDKLAMIVPPGELKAIAYFPPEGALGRIRPGMPARLRLDGFPSTQYGSLSVTVSSVATEARDGKVWVEFLLSPDPLSAIPLQHGLPGTVEVEIDHVSPATLVLRAAGKLLTSPSASSESHSEQEVHK
ncbi:MAG: HlyD family efflux transporter periplasmic adaptor subunit [Acidobacteriota bacterium]